jgi:hypothetical protein
MCHCSHCCLHQAQMEACSAGMSYSSMRPTCAKVLNTSRTAANRPGRSTMLLQGPLRAASLSMLARVYVSNHTAAADPSLKRVGALRHVSCSSHGGDNSTVGVTVQSVATADLSHIKTMGAPVAKQRCDLQRAVVVRAIRLPQLQRCMKCSTVQHAAFMHQCARSALYDIEMELYHHNPGVTGVTAIPLDRLGSGSALHRLLVAVYPCQGRHCPWRVRCVVRAWHAVCVFLKSGLGVRRASDGMALSAYHCNTQQSSKHCP